MGQSRPSLGGEDTGREREQEKNIKEEGQEREKAREEKLLERGARRSAACCQVPGFPSPLHKRTPAGLKWEGGGVERGKGPIHKKSSALPPSLEVFTPHLHLMAAAWVHHYPLFSHLTLQHKPIIKPSAPAQLLSYWCDMHEHTTRHKGFIMVHNTRCCHMWKCLINKTLSISVAPTLNIA